jgi:hypothetical protein
VQIDICVARGAGRAPCPPRTFVEYNRYGRERGLVIASGPRVAAMHGARMVRMEAAERAHVHEHAQAVRQVAAERRMTEAKMPVGAPRQPRTASVAMPHGYVPPARPAAGAAAATAHPNQTQGAHTAAPPAQGSTVAPHPPGTTMAPPGPNATAGKPAPGKPMPPAKPMPPKQPPAKPQQQPQGNHQ